MSTWYLYGLTTPDHRQTYAGVTVNLKRRLRQHNGEISRGARSTTGRAANWRFLFYVSGLPDRSTAQQLEWRMHRRTSGGGPFGTSRAAVRAWQLWQALHLERFTKQAPPTSELLPHLCIHWCDETFAEVGEQLIV
jgi:predicted GIY-YIG superfamily endonuclease